MTISDVEELLNEAAQSLLEQLQYSNGFSTAGESSLAEATLAIHIAAAFMQRRAAVRAESPFKSDKTKKINHLDLLIDLRANCRAEGRTGFRPARFRPAGASWKKASPGEGLLPSGAPCYYWDRDRFGAWLETTYKKAHPCV